MIKKIYVKKNVFLKDAPKDVQQTLRELGFDENFDFGQTFADFLNRKGVAVTAIDDAELCEIYFNEFEINFYNKIEEINNIDNISKYTFTLVDNYEILNHTLKLLDNYKEYVQNVGRIKRNRRKKHDVKKIQTDQLKTKRVDMQNNFYSDGGLYLNA